MISHRVIHRLSIASLWLSIIFLAILTALSAITSFHRSDCGSSTTLTNGAYSKITLSGVASTCTTAEIISNTVYRHTSYFQSAQIIVIRVVGTLSLMVFKPALVAMVWEALQTTTSGTPKLRVTAFQEAVGLSNSPALTSAGLYLKTSRKLSFKSCFRASSQHHFAHIATGGIPNL